MAGFDDARRRALMGDLLRHLLGRPVDLLSFGEVRERLRLSNIIDRGTLEVPLDGIVGTLGRGREFNRAFLPREESLRERWVELEELAEGPAGFPAVELYKVGETYFVVDGHHRVSVARSLGASTIEAMVKEFASSVELAPEESLEDMLLKGGRADFLDVTGLEPAHPEEFRVTFANGYERLLEHINVHRYFMGVTSGRVEIPWDEAVSSWRDTVYGPMVEVIRCAGIMEEFPGRTETDLYLFTMDHLHFLRQEYGEEEVAPTQAVRHFAAMYPGGRRLLARLRSWWRRRFPR
ncbi:MAG: hypothetical protein V1750_08685 [Acidobacteriota bacterium]